jgi:biotin-independent malonate decarboxylase gamma subunit
VSANGASRGRTWFEALAGTSQAPAPASVLCADTDLGDERVRYLAVVPDPDGWFPRARRGEVGLEEAWTLARYVREAIEADRDGRRRAIVAIVDVPSQAYGRIEELCGLHLACAGAVDAYVTARLEGHPVVALVVGRALSGGFLAHGYQANRILALDDPGVTIHAMGKESTARVTRRTVDELDELASRVPPIAYDIEAYAGLGILQRLIGDINADEPGADDVDRVRRELASAIGDARSSPPDLSIRLTSEAARRSRAASIEVRERLAGQWTA